MLGPDVVVVEEAGLLLGEDDDSSGPVGEPFEHRPPSVGGSLRQEPSTRCPPLRFARNAGGMLTGSWVPGLTLT